MPGRSRAARTGGVAALLAAAVWLGASAVAESAERAEPALCVGPAPRCSPTLTAALKAAHDGDTITVSKGTFAGAAIEKSLTLVGAGARATIVRGGGPVLTIGTGAGRRITVSISRLTITGGVSRSSTRGTCGPDIPECGAGYPRATALAGGVAILPGSTVTISDSVVRNNRAAPTIVVPSVRARCPDGPCPFAQAGGGGIDNWGTLTLIRTTVSGNEAAGALTAQANGGGIASEARSRLTLIDSTVTRNRAVAAPNGRFADGGGIYVDKRGALVIRDSVVSRNVSRLASAYPTIVRDSHGSTAGIFVGNGGSATIERTAIAGNVVTIDAPNGKPAGFDAGICVCGPRSSLVMKNSSVSNNRLTVKVATSPEGGSGGGLEADGVATISGTRVTANRTVVTSPDGVALAVGAVNLFVGGTTPAAVMSDSVISGNSVVASSTTGSARIQGVGLANNGSARLDSVRITGNTGRADGPSGWVHGGGIFNGLVFNVPKPALTLRNTTVAGNSITADPGLAVQGAGLYTDGFRVRREGGVIRSNRPDQCHGC